jgi:hypothetical protein
MWLIQNKQKFEQKLHFLRFVDYVSFRLCAESGRMKNMAIPGMSALDLLNFEDNVPEICFTELMLEQLAVAREIHRRWRTFRTLSFRRTIKYEHRRRIPTRQDVHHSCRVRSFLPGKKSAILRVQLSPLFRWGGRGGRNLEPSENNFFNQ